MMLSHQANRYRSPLLGRILQKMDHQRMTQQLCERKKIEHKRKMTYSYSACMERAAEIERRPLFNNKTKEGGLLDGEMKLISYRFIPKYRNQTFIMPDRVFQRGNAGKRFHIKMKDTSIYSFKEEEGEKQKEALNREEKEKTILSRKADQFNRIIDEDDGKVRSRHMKEILKSRKRFKFTDTRSQLFEETCPMLEPKDPQTKVNRKTSLAKTFDFSNKWRPNSRQINFFQKTVSKSAYSHYPQTSSVL